MVRSLFKVSGDVTRVGFDGFCLGLITGKNIAFDGFSVGDKEPSWTRDMFCGLVVEAGMGLWVTVDECATGFMVGERWDLGCECGGMTINPKSNDGSSRLVAGDCFNSSFLG